MKRRTFLQKFGSILTVLGAAQAEWLTLGNRYYQALAQPIPRKLALLVGINQYPQSPGLLGCLTDVDLQRELLIHRFGFQPSDIMSLTNEKATRESIETAFFEHLVKQARPDDVVVFHYSGYGSRVKLEMQETQNALVPVNGRIVLQENHFVNYILEETLLLMLRSLATNRVTAVLDTSYYTGSNSLPTGLGIRARPVPEQAILLTEEVELQLQLQEKVSTEQSVIVLSATSDPKQLAREEQLSGFSAGLFTYALTQYLWEATPATTIQVCLSHVGGSVQQLGNTKQQPALLLDKKNQLSRTLIADILLPNTTFGAEGVITETEDDGRTVLLWLGGLPLQVLENYGVNSRFTLVTKEGLNVETKGDASLQLRSRSGLIAKAQISNLESTIPLEVGQLVQEAVRVIPRNISLTVALDRLERIERVDATSAFATISRASGVVAGEQPADYVFGKLPEAKNKDLVATNSRVVSPSRYGLFSLGSELIPNTDGEAGEAAKVAVLRLAPKLQTLLAAKLWRLTENTGSSRLGVKATLELIGALTPRSLIQRETVRTQAETSSKKAFNPELGDVPTVTVGSRIQYRVENMSDRPVYLMLLGLNSSKSAIALFPWYKSTESELSEAKPVLKDIIISPGQTLTIPQMTAGFEWVVQGPTSLSETQLIFSTAPFTHSLAALEAAKHPQAQEQRIQPLISPLEVAQAVMQDLHNASEISDINGTAIDSYVLDVNHWASLSFVYQVV